MNPIQENRHQIQQRQNQKQSALRAPNGEIVRQEIVRRSHQPETK